MTDDTYADLPVGEPIAVAEAPSPAPDHTAAVQGAIREWVAIYIHNSPVSRATEALNHLNQVLPHLETLILKGL